MKLHARLILVTATVVGLLLPAQLAAADDAPVGTITGTVSTTDGTISAPAADVGVKLWKLDPSTSELIGGPTTTTDDDGSYSFDGQPAGTYAVMAFGDACEYAEETWYGGARPENAGADGVVNLADAQHLTLDDLLVDIELCDNVANPAVTGTRRFGSRVTATTGAWNADARTLGFSYQWQRVTTSNAVTNIPLATARSYVLTAKDVGFSIRVRVTAKRVGAVPGTGYSDSTLVGKAVSSTGVRLSRTTVHTTGRARLAVAISPTALPPTGRVSVRIDGHPRVGVTLRAAHRGRATLTLPRLKKGTHRVVARYVGSGSVFASTSRTLRLTIIR